MVCASDHDPVAAIILQSSPADVDTVIVGGQIRKRAGKLLPVQTAPTSPAGRAEIEWSDVAKALIKSRLPIQKRTIEIDTKAGVKASLQHLQVDPADLVDVE